MEPKTKLHICKYQGAGNDFVLIDNRQGLYSNLEYKQIALLCDRRFGVGADGLMLLEKHEKYPFCMRFFNSDGMPGSMCGNGGRCISAFALRLGLVKENEPFGFWSSDGAHQATVISQLGNRCMVRLQMRDVSCYACNKDRNVFLLDTGSPHYVTFRSECQNIDVVAEGRKIRFSDHFPLGVNVDFVENEGSALLVRTYERGVEDETFSCGTGAVASAMAEALKEYALPGHHRTDITTKGGQLQVDFKLSSASRDSEESNIFALPPRFSLLRNRVFTQVFLEGLATFVFEADIEL
ncbi:MAG: diaminopimelate epimerase [Bacteroides sp.]|nr:diaminopimelate epimerase [Ruminococcus flavefaciens]MCM1554216.1 diaminopimelate epimerase [Bacteroides sp.]